MNEISQVNQNENVSFADLFESSVEKTDSLKDGDIVTGTVIRINKDHVLVDIGYKSEGLISLHEFVGSNGEVTISEGSEVEVLIESKEDDDGIITLSKEKADKLKVWDEVSEACERDELIEGVITMRVKGGLSVTIRGGVKAFLPGSQVDLRPVRNLDKLLGENHQFKVIKFNKKRGNIVLSRRALLESERDALKKDIIGDLQEGKTVTGVIKNITEYGAFVDLGGIDGLLHITDMSWGRVNHPSELFSVNDEVTCKVLKYNSDTERVSLGLKQMIEDPWIMATDKYAPQSKIEGKVVSLTDYGAFIEIEQGVEGLIHVSEMTWAKPKHPSKILEMGQTVECLVLDIDAQNKRISLGLKQLAPDPWTVFTQKYNPGDVIRGHVRSVTDYGIFVEIEEGVDGMVHKSDVSWTQRVTNPADLYHKGDEVEAIILSINHEEKKVSLGIKQLFEDPWNYIPERYTAGTVLEVRVLMAGEEFGAYAELERGVEGYIPSSELGVLEGKVEPGQIVKATILIVDPSERRLSLSFKEAADKEIDSEEHKFKEEGSVRKAASPLSRGAATFGDVFKEKFGSIAPSTDENPTEKTASETKEEDAS